MESVKICTRCHKKYDNHDIVVCISCGNEYFREEEIRKSTYDINPGIPTQIVSLVKSVFGEELVTIVKFDANNVEVKKGNELFSIVKRQASAYSTSWTLFKTITLEDGTSHKEEQRYGYFYDEAGEKEDKKHRNLGCVALLIIVVLTIIMFKSCDAKPSIGAGCVFIEDIVRDRLKAPSTAKFSSCQGTQMGSSDLYKFTGYVDAQNSFGAKIRSNYLAVLEYEDGRWTLKDIAVD